MTTTAPQTPSEGAREYREWWEALINEGFTETQALALISRPLVIVNVAPSPVSPEIAELATKLTSIANRDLAMPPEEA